MTSSKGQPPSWGGSAPPGDDFAATTLDRPAMDVEIPAGPPSGFGAPPPAAAPKPPAPGFGGPSFGAPPPSAPMALPPPSFAAPSKPAPPSQAQFASTMMLPDTPAAAPSGSDFAATALDRPALDFSAAQAPAVAPKALGAAPPRAPGVAPAEGSDTALKLALIGLVVLIVLVLVGLVAGVMLSGGDGEAEATESSSAE